MIQQASRSGEREIHIPLGERSLIGDQGVPEGALGAVLFAHGSGSSRRSPQNRRVAQTLRNARLATLLVDLLTPEEAAADARAGHVRFDIDLLAKRLITATDWFTASASLRWLPLGYFGASTGAAAALVAAAQRPYRVAAVVSRGGRPDLAMASLYEVRAPTLLIVGGLDFPVIQMNRDASARLRTQKRLETIPGATHLFEEPGAADEVARLARDWFIDHLFNRSSGFECNGARGQAPYR